MDHLEVLRGLNFGFAGLGVVIGVMLVLVFGVPMFALGTAQESQAANDSVEDFHAHDPDFFPARRAPSDAAYALWVCWLNRPPAMRFAGGQAGQVTVAA